MFVALNAPHLHLRIVAVAQNASLSEVTEKKYGEKKILISLWVVLSFWLSTEKKKKIYNGFVFLYRLQIKLTGEILGRFRWDEVGES